MNDAPRFTLDAPIATLLLPEERPKKKRRKSPEHTFQAWADRFIDRVVLPPLFTTGIDHAATDMANIGRRMSVRGRGVKYGIPDVFIAQRQGAVCRTLWLELKRGSAVTETQRGIHRAMFEAGQLVVVCNTMVEILMALRAVRMALHPNADALATEYEMRVTAKEAAPAVAKKPRGNSWGKGGKPRAPRYTGRGITTAKQVGR